MEAIMAVLLPSWSVFLWKYFPIRRARQSLFPQNLSKTKPPPVFRSQISSDCFIQIMDQCELQQTFEIVSTPAPRLKQAQHGDAVRMVGHGLNMAQSKLLLPTSARLQLQSFEQLPEIL